MLTNTETETPLQAIFGHRLRLRVSGICLQNDAILLVKHHYEGKMPYLWSPPGGGMLFGETAEQTLRREFAEETGLMIEVKGFLFVNEFLDLPLHAIELFFEVGIASGELIRGRDPELSPDKQIITEVCFMTLKELQQEPTACLHSLLHNCHSLSDILQRQHYSLYKPK